jgi:hypothetical protein
MQNPWWLVVTVGLLSGAVSVMLTYSFNYKKERAQFLREKAERLFVSLDNFDRWILSDIAPSLQATHFVPVHQEKEYIVAAMSDYAVVATTADIYFPHLTKYIKAVETARDSLAIAKNDCQSGGDIERLRLLASAFSEAIAAAKNKCAAQCRDPLREVRYVRLVRAPWN